MKRTGFTLVEILIVVIILGILAAIVIPQFTEASNQARESSLQSDLHSLRGQVELYKHQHLEKTPFDVVGTGCTGAQFKEQLTSRTNAAGEIMPAGADAATQLLYPFGPYVQKWPENGFVASTNKDDPEAGQISFGTAEPAPGDGTTGWYFNTETGKVSVNTDITMSGGKYAAQVNW